MRRFSVIPIIQPLESSTMVVDAARRGRCSTRESTDSLIMSSTELLECRAPMHDARLAHRCKGERARRDMATEMAP
jgi:hypothetical protein